jgi:histidinol phosphatase-like enzyme (inositol monophosphatase family)
MASQTQASDTKALREYMEHAVSIAETAGPISLRYFRNAIDIEDKSGGVAFDPVTRADKEVEASIRRDLERLYPDHGILGEEEAERESDSGYRWVIDPIDGTRAFISGVPAWGILIGLTIDERSVVGVMHQPYLRETFLGDTRSAWIRRGGEERVIRTRDTQEISSAVLYATHPSMFEGDEERSAFERVADESQMMRFGGDCYSYCLLALGMIDLVIEASLQPYDIIPLIPIIEGAGGIVTDWQGGSASGGGRIIAAANTKLHAEALKILNA